MSANMNTQMHEHRHTHTNTRASTFSHRNTHTHTKTHAECTDTRRLALQSESRQCPLARLGLSHSSIIPQALTGRPDNAMFFMDRGGESAKTMKWERRTPEHQYYFRICLRNESRRMTSESFRTCSCATVSHWYLKGFKSVGKCS